MCSRSGVSSRGPSGGVDSSVELSDWFTKLELEPLRVDLVTFENVMVGQLAVGESVFSMKVLTMFLYV